MKKSTKATEVKKRIIEVTIALIQASNGNAAEITTRDIAEKAEVGNGLINYHFQTKENLIAICVQRIVGQVVKNFNTNIANQNTAERTTNAATAVFEFYLPTLLFLAFRYLVICLTLQKIVTE